MSSQHENPRVPEATTVLQCENLRGCKPLCLFPSPRLPFVLIVDWMFLTCLQRPLLFHEVTQKPKRWSNQVATQLWM